MEYSSPTSYIDPCERIDFRLTNKLGSEDFYISVSMVIKALFKINEILVKYLKEDSQVSLDFQGDN